MSDVFRIGDEALELDCSYVMGILNVTPDSFSDGGDFDRVGPAVQRIGDMRTEGALFIDVGGESTRPGYEGVSVEEEIERVAPVIKKASKFFPGVVLSVDTSKSEVAKAALSAGARVVNDVWGFRKDEALAEVTAEAGASCVLMHNARMGWSQESVIDSVRAYWEESVRIATQAGISEDRILLDPGIGFGTNREEDLEMLKGLAELKAFGFPLLLGTSRKRITGELFDLEVNERIETTVATSVAAVGAGVDFFRVHDVLENVRALKMADAIYRS